MLEPHRIEPTYEVLVVNGLRLNVGFYGNRQHPPVVLVHGGCAHLHWWDRFAAAIADRFYVIAPDLRGHGDSEHASPAAYTIADHTRDLGAIVDHLGVDQAAFVGHSLGALVAANYAVQAPQHVRRLALIDSNARLSAASVHYLSRLRRFPHPVYKSFEQAVQRFRLLPTPTTASRDSLAAIAAKSIRPRGDGTWSLKFDRDTLGQFEPLDLIPSLRAWHRPLLVVRGEHSTVLTSDRFDHLLAEVPHAEGATIDDAHHHLMLDKPVEFEQVLRPFLGTDMP